MELKIPPQDIQSEQALIAGMLSDSSIVAQVESILTPSDFYREAHRHIMEAIFDLKEAADLVTLSHWLRSKDLLEKSGGEEYLVKFVDYFISAGWKYHAEIVRDMAARRNLINECALVSDACFLLHESLPEIIQSHETKLQDIEQGSKTRFRQGVHVSNVFTPERMLESYREHIRGLKSNRFITGINEIDRRIRGVSGGEVLVIIARAGSFKTAWLQNMLRNYIHHSSWGAVLFEIEMPISNITERYHEMVQGISGREIEGFYTQDQEGVGLYREDMERDFIKDLAHLFVIPTKVGTPQIEKYVALIQKHHKIKVGLVGIDYLGLMDGEGRGEYEIVTNIARSVKEVAKLLDLPIILLSQTSRKGGTGDTEIDLDMGRGSGAIEENADFVLGLWQDHDDLICKIIKNRKGSKGTRIKLDLNPETLTIGSESEIWIPPRKSKKKTPDDL